MLEDNYWAAKAGLARLEGGEDRISRINKTVPTFLSEERLLVFEQACQ